jgi:putative methionine-R-sulfoxide reductase with GAF domain
MFNALLSTAAYTRQADKDRARLVYLVSLALLVMFVVFAAVGELYPEGATIVELLPTNLFVQVTVVLAALVLLATWIGTRSGRLRWSAAGPIALWILTAVNLVARGGLVTPGDSLVFAVLIILGGLLFGRAGLVITYLMALLGVFVAFQQPTTLGPSGDLGAFDGIYPSLTLVAIFTGLALRLTRSAALEEEQLARERLLEAVSAVAQRIIQHRSVDEVLSQTVEQILTNYPSIYHAQIFLIDDQAGEARLRASTGDVGQLLMRRRHSLPIGSRSVIGQVTMTGQPVIAQSGADSVHRRNEFLPDTQIEMALPMRIGSRVIGALDLQSRDPNGINPEDTPVFQTLADTIAVAIDNGELFDLTQQRIAENQRLIEQLTRAVGEVERLNRQLTGDAWSGFLAPQSGRVGADIRFDERREAQHSPFEGGLSPIMRDTMAESQVIQRPTGETMTIGIPLRIRGESVGVIELELPDRPPLTAAEIEMALRAGDRFGALADSLRASEESRRIAERESILNAISAQMQASYDVQLLLSEAARGLQGAVGAQRVAIRLGAPAGAANGAPTSTGNGRREAAS